MNLPASAVQFLGASPRATLMRLQATSDAPLADAFAGSFAAPHWESRSLPLVHCYSFLRTDETEDDVRKVCSAAICLPRPRLTPSCERSKWRLRSAARCRTA